MNVARATGAGTGRRPRGTERRDHPVKVWLSRSELQAVSAAAGRAGKTAGAFLGQAGLAAAKYEAMPVPDFWQQLLAELFMLEDLVRRAGVNVNQAVARFHATGQPAPDLEAAVRYCLRVIRRLDEAAELVRRRLS